MHGKRSLKAAFKVVFMIFQSVMFICGISLMISSLVLYAKGRRLLGLPLKILGYTSVLSTFLVLSAVSGLMAINSKERWRAALYIILILTLVNMQAVLIMKFPRLTEHARKTSEAFWNKIDNNQRLVLEENFGCCGLDKDSQRASCAGRKPCIGVFYRIMQGFRSSSEKTLILLIFGESLSTGLLCLLKMRK